MKYFDLHCDTLTCIPYENRRRAALTEGDGTPVSLLSNPFMVSLDRASFEKYAQVLAIYSSHNRSDDECFDDFFRVMDSFERELDTLPPFFEYILAVEGGKLLGNDIKRLDTLYEKGVRILTLVWGGECCIGGAHDTNVGLSPFGERVLYRLFELGMIPDLSHASDKMFYSVCDFAKREGRKFIASHSNSREIRAVSRNLTDEMFSILVESGGICGINLWPYFLSDGDATADDIAKHIKRFLSLGGEDALAIGADFDGIDRTPLDVAGIWDIPYLKNALIERGIPKSVTDKIFYDNAKGFFTQNGIMK